MSYLDKLKSKLSVENKSHPPEKESGFNNTNLKTEKQLPVAKIDEKSKSPNIIIPKEESDQFFMSQTLIKRLTDQYGNFKEVCPRQIYEEFITKTRKIQTLPMLEGQFGETICLGGGAKNQKVTDLPRHKRTGEKLTSQLNIEEQARRFPFICNANGISVIPNINTQFPIVKRFGTEKSKRLIKTEIDIFPSPFLFEHGFGLSVIDLKFTGDVNSTFSDFGWGDPDSLDHCQADITYWLLQDFDMDLNIKYNPHKAEIYKTVFGNPTIRNMIENEDIKFLYLILGYKKQPLEEQVKIIQRNYRDDNGTLIRQKELDERIRKCYAQLNEWAMNSWPPEEGDRCFKCPVNKSNGGYCDKAPRIKEV